MKDVSKPRHITSEACENLYMWSSHGKARVYCSWNAADRGKKEKLGLGQYMRAA